MRIWALISQKGGSGKSTLSTQLAVYAGQCGEKVIILDLDPQASAHAWHVLRGEGMAPPVVRTLPEKLHGTIDAIRDTGAFTLVIIDTAPHSDRTAVEAIQISDLLICPTRPSNFDVSALKDTANLIGSMNAIDKAIVVANCVHARGADATASKVAEMVKRLGLAPADAYVVDRAAFINATDIGKGVTEKGFDSKAAKDIQELWAEVNKTWPVMKAAKEKMS